MTCFITAKADLRGFCSHPKQFVSLVSAHKNGLENTRELRNDMSFNDLSADVIHESLHGNLTNECFRIKKTLILGKVDQLCSMQLNHSALRSKLAPSCRQPPAPEVR